MKIPSVVLRHPTLAWVAPAIAVLVLGTVATGAFTSSSSTASLPETNPRALLAAVEAAAKNPNRGYSGTIVVDASLNSDEDDSAESSVGRTPVLGSDTATSASAVGALESFTTMLSGPHTLRFWYGGPERQRVALLRANSEIDFFHHGADLWQWDSASQVVSHSRATVNDGWTLPLTFAVLTPQQLAAHALNAIDASTVVSIGQSRMVADRPCYELVITPQGGQSRISAVRLSIDGQTKVPLSAQVYAQGSDTEPAVDASFTMVRFKRPAASYFTFSPVAAEASHTPEPRPSAVGGDGFATVIEYAASADRVAGGVAPMMRPVSGAFGSGELLESPLLCLLALPDGRVYLGSVDPDTLYQAAAGG